MASKIAEVWPVGEIQSIVAVRHDNTTAVVDVAGGWRALGPGGPQPARGFWPYRFDSGRTAQAWAVAYERRGTKGLVICDNTPVVELDRSYFGADKIDYPVDITQYEERVLVAHSSHDSHQVQLLEFSPDLECYEHQSTTGDNELGIVIQLTFSSDSTQLAVVRRTQEQYHTVEIIEVGDVLEDPELLNTHDIVELAGSVAWVGWTFDDILMVVTQDVAPEALTAFTTRTVSHQNTMLTERDIEVAALLAADDDDDMLARAIAWGDDTEEAEAPESEAGDLRAPADDTLYVETASEDAYAQDALGLYAVVPSSPVSTQFLNMTGERFELAQAVDGGVGIVRGQTVELVTRTGSDLIDVGTDITAITGVGDAVLWVLAGTTVYEIHIEQ